MLERTEVGRMPGDLSAHEYFFPWRTRAQTSVSAVGGATFNSGNTYEARQRACVPRLNLQRFVEQMITEVLLVHVLHGIEVLEELLLTEKKTVSEQQAELLPAEEGVVADPDVGVHPQAVRLVLVLLDFPRDLSHLPPLAEVDEMFAVAQQEVGIAFFCLQDVGQVYSW